MDMIRVVILEDDQTQVDLTKKFLEQYSQTEN